MVSHNRAWGNALGILVRHSQKVIVSSNASWENCIGVFLLADGQAGGSGQTAVLNNTSLRTTRCASSFRQDFCRSSAAGVSSSRGHGTTPSFTTS